MNILLYADGGVVRANPSPYAGTWAFVRVEGESVEVTSGYLTPDYFNQRTMTNNESEMWAAIKALESMEDDWSGVIHTDSQCTISRFTRLMQGKELNPKIPTEIVIRAETVLLRLGRITFRFVKGHPSKIDLARVPPRTKRGVPVSRYQVMADEACTEQSTIFTDSFLSVSKTA